MYQRKEERSLGELLSELADEFATLVRQEVNLARTEIAQTASLVGRDAGILAAGGLIAYAGLLAIIAAVILGLIALGLPGWLSALIVGVVVAGIGYFLVRRSLNNLKRRNFAPPETIASLKEAREWTKDQMK